MNNDIKIFATFTKKDDDQRIVEGYASSEALDSQGEVVKITAIEKALPDYMKFANIREMHQWSAVGKTVSANIDKAKKGLYLVAKVIDKDAWEKCKEGVYNGFSIGGKVVKRINNTIEALTLNEISLVDRPANPEAVFSIVKSESGDLTKDYMSKGAWDARILASMIVTLEDILSTKKEGKNTKATNSLNSAITALKKVIAHEIMEPTKDSMEEGKENPMSIMMATFTEDLQKDTHCASRLVMMIQTLESMLSVEKEEDDDISVRGIAAGITALKEATIQELNAEEKVEEKENHKTVKAESILSLAEDLRKVLNILESQGKSTLTLNNALTALKTIAENTLSKEDKQKFDHILYRMDFAELNKTNFSQIKQTEENKEKPDIKKYVDHSWMPGYFADLRKVMK